MSRRAILVGLFCVLAGGHAASAQTNLQLWGDVSLNGSLSERLSWAVDLEPQALVAATGDAPGWASFSVTPNIEYAARGWLDLIGEVGTGYTRQDDGLNSFELTPRVGVRLHLWSRNLKTLIPNALGGRERPPARRFAIRDRVLVEQRNLFYNQGQPTSSTTRIRNRLECQLVLNRARMTEDGSRTWLSDWEWFIPFGDPNERFASRQRIRTGLAFRHSYTWRTEVMYVWTRSRDTTNEPFSTSDNALSITIKRFFP